MVDVEVKNIVQQYDDDDEEVESYIVEYSIPQYENTYRTEPIPADKFDREFAKERIANEASPLVAAPKITVKFPSETSNESEESTGRRTALAVLGVGIAGLGGGWALSQFGGADDTVSDSRPTEQPEVSSNTPTETPTNRPDTATPSPSETVALQTGSVYFDFEDADLSNWQKRGDNSANKMGIADDGHDSQYSLYLDHNGTLNNFWAEATLDSVITPSIVSFWLQPTKADQYSKDMFRLRNGDTDVIWFTNHRQNDGVYFRFGDGNDEEDRKRIRDGAITIDTDRFVEIRLEQIDWENGSIGEVYIDDEQVTTDAPFLNTMSGFDAVGPYSVGGGNSAFRIDDIGWK